MTSVIDATRLRLLVVTARYLPLVGGTEIHTYETARRIAQAGHDVTVLTTNPGVAFPAEEWSDGVHVKRVACWPAQADYYLAPRLMHVVTEGEWDLVHCQGVHTLVSPLAMLAALPKRRRPISSHFIAAGTHPVCARDCAACSMRCCDRSSHGRNA